MKSKKMWKKCQRNVYLTTMDTYTKLISVSRLLGWGHYIYDVEWGAYVLGVPDCIFSYHT
jgi:hypothetical protein